MVTTAVVLIVAGTLGLLYIVARTSRTPERNPLNYARGTTADDDVRDPRAITAARKS